MSAPTWRDDPELAMDQLQERAAIIEEGEKCSSYMAEMMAAHGAGFVSWGDATTQIKMAMMAAKKGEK